MPREHGAWGMLLVPLVAGAAVGLSGGGRIVQLLLLTTAVSALFWLRAPLESWLGASPVRPRTAEERRFVRTTALGLAAAATISLGPLFLGGQNRSLLPLGGIAGLAFFSQTLLKKSGRKARMPAQLVGALGLTCTSPAAYYVATGQLDATAWALWLANFLFAGEQIHFVWLRIQACRAASLQARFSQGRAFLAGQTGVLLILGLAAYFAWLPGLALVAFIPIFIRGLAWFVAEPKPLAVRRLGWTELTHSMIFGVLLILAFRLGP